MPGNIDGYSNAGQYFVVLNLAVRREKIGFPTGRRKRGFLLQNIPGLHQLPSTDTKRCPPQPSGFSDPNGVL